MSAEEKIRCWSCGKVATTQQFYDCDWNCPSCGNEGPDEDDEDE